MMYQITDNLATVGLDWENEPVHGIYTDWSLVDIRDILYDEPKNDIEDYDLCMDLVIRQIQKGKKVIIGCGAGHSRSNAIAIGVLVKYYNMDFYDAMELIRAKVPVANIEPCHIIMLKRRFGVTIP